MIEFLLRLPLFDRFFRPREDSRNAARERLRAALVSDRHTVAPGLIRCLESDLQELLARYVEIESDSLQIDLREREGAMTLSSRVLVRRVHRQTRLPEEALKAEQERLMRLKRHRRRRRFRSSEASAEG